MLYGKGSKKSRIQETKNLSTDADSSTAAKKLLSLPAGIAATAAKGLLRQGAFVAVAAASTKGLLSNKKREKIALPPAKFGSEGGLTNQRPGIDHVT